jgi:hypothetical protein
MEVIMNQGTVEQKPRVNLFWQGIAGGIISGIIFAMAEMILNVLMGKPFFGTMIGGYVSIVKPKHEVAETQREGRTAMQGHSHG